MAEYVNRFNKYIKYLIDIANSSTNIDKSYIESANKFFETQLNTFPTAFIDNIGPVLVRLSDKIKNKNDDILKYFILEINNNCQDMDEENKKILSYVITEIKNVWSNYDEDEKNQIFKILKILLSETHKFLTI
jgi:hypothetical protein